MIALLGTGSKIGGFSIGYATRYSYYHRYRYATCCVGICYRYRRKKKELDLSKMRIKCNKMSINNESLRPIDRIGDTLLEKNRSTRARFHCFRESCLFVVVVDWVMVSNKLVSSPVSFCRRSSIYLVRVHSIR